MNWSLVCMLISICLYLALMVLVGVVMTKRNRNAGDFYLGGRQLGPIVTAMSAEASDMSSWLMMGLPGVAYFTGLADVTWTAIGLAIGTYLNWLLVARRLRRYSELTNSITVPDFFKNRFHDSGRSLVGIAAVIIIVFFVPYTASGFAACGKLFSSLLGVNYVPAMLLSAVIIVAYTTLGGFLAASTTDLIQSVVMTIAILSVVIFGVSVAGGVDRVVENARGVAGYLTLNRAANIATGESSPYTFLTVISTMAWGLGYFGMPHILLRFMAIRDERKIKLSRRIATVWVVISMAAAVLIGVIGYAVSAAGSIELFGSAAAAEKVVIAISDLMSTYSVPLALLAGLILAGILACTMSTADSQLLAAASSVSENLMDSVMGIKLSPKFKIIVARATVVAVSAVGVLLALDSTSSVFRIVSFAWAGFGAAFGPVMLMSLFWRRMNKAGALAGMIVGGSMVFIWKYVVAPFGSSAGIKALTVYELLPAFLLSLAAILIASLVTRAPAREVVAEFDRAAGD